MRRPQPRSPGDAALWIVFCAFCNCSGWLLSALRQLNARGYLVLCLASLLLLYFARNRLPELNWSSLEFHKLRRRMRRLFPFGFMALAGLAILGGILYAPNNYDALAYRTPRVLHWLAEGRWHWIHTDFARLNVRGCGTEWVTAPLLALTHSDRGLFLISAISFLLLPGRVFGLLTRLGVRGRIAWQWMWLLPTGYCYLLQAGSIANDLFGALLAMTAIEFALRAGQTQKWPEAAISIWAAALMTAGKAFNLLLLLPWALAMLPSFRLLWQRPFSLAPLFLLAAGASLLPTAALNLLNCGDWTGMRLEQTTNLASGARMFHLAVNALLLLVYNFILPVFPWANAWNHWMDRIIPEALAWKLQRNFEPFGAHFHVGEMEMEEGAGLGCFLSLLLLAWALHRFLHKRKPGRGFTSGPTSANIPAATSLGGQDPPSGKSLAPATSPWTARFRALLRTQMLVPVAAWVAALIFMSQSGLSCPARYLAPFYVLLMTPLLAGLPASATLIQSRYWKPAGTTIFLAGGLLLAVSPARPLWPAQSVLRALGGEASGHALARRAWTVYSVYNHRADAFGAARIILPASANPLGVVTSDDPETSLWRPFGRRRILHIRKEDGPGDARARGLRYALVSSAVLENWKVSLEPWLAERDAELVQQLRLELRASNGPRDWYLVKFR